MEVDQARQDDAVRVHDLNAGRGAALDGGDIVVERRAGIQEAAAVAVAWLRFGRQTIPLRYVLFIPLYVLWKVPLYLSLLVRGKQRTWERTARLPQRPEEETEGSSGPSQPL
jgi:hypothetical protein